MDQVGFDAADDVGGGSGEMDAGGAVGEDECGCGIILLLIVGFFCRVVATTVRDCVGTVF